MGMMTFVVEFEDGKEPPIFSGMSVLGGKLVAASMITEMITSVKMKRI